MCSKRWSFGVSSASTVWGVGGVVCLFGGLVIGHVLFPVIFERLVLQKITLSEESTFRVTWEQMPGLGFNVFLFNITNPSEILRGDRPVVQEVGPYCYKEIKEKTCIEDDSEGDTVSYKLKSTWFVSQKNSKCLSPPRMSGNEFITTLNVPLMSIFLLAEKDYPSIVLPLLNLALPNIFGGFKDIFLQVEAKTLLFEGVPIDCSSFIFNILARIVCSKLRENSRPLRTLGQDFYSFSFFGPQKNGTLEPTKYTLKRGIKNGADVGKLVALDDKTELPFWRGHCNKIQGTDASIFPPFRRAENGSLVAYASEICRVITGVYEGRHYYRGVEGYAYSATLGDTDHDPRDRCSCPADDRCLGAGLLDAFKCQGAPLVASLPHFYQGSSSYVNGVVGLSPDKDKHGILIVLEPISGTPLLVRKRIQMSFDMKPVGFTSKTRNLKRTLVPLFWAEEVLDLNDDLMQTLQTSLFRPLMIADVIKWLIVSVGGVVCLASVLSKIRQHRRDRVHILADQGEPEGEHQQKVVPEVQRKYLECDDNVNADPFFIGV